MDTPIYKGYITVPRYTCQRCDHKWISLNELSKPGVEPVQCPHCHSPYWRTKRVRPGKDAGTLPQTNTNEQKSTS